MKHKFIAGYILGATMFGAVGAFAGQYVATENPYPVQLNGNDVSIEGYNINGSTYFKLRDIANVVGEFDVDFNNDTIQLSKDGYEYSTIKYYSGKGSFAPDFGDYCQITEDDQMESNDYSMWYNVDCTMHDYPYNAEKAEQYTSLLEALGFTLLDANKSYEYADKTEVYGKDGNYIRLECADTVFTVTTFPINSDDYSFIADRDLFYNTVLNRNK